MPATLPTSGQNMIKLSDDGETKKPVEEIIDNNEVSKDEQEAAGEAPPIELSKKERKKQEKLAKKKAEARAKANAEPSKLAEFFKSLNYIGTGSYRRTFIQNVGLMLGAGLNLMDSVETIANETKKKSIKKVIVGIVDTIKQGTPFWRALKDSGFFTPYEISMVRIGEDSGNLAQNLEYLAEQEEKDHSLKGKIKTAMMYPSIVMVLMFIIVVGLGMFVLPNLLQVLFAMDVELPWTTRMVILFTNFMQSYGLYTVPGVAIAGITWMTLSKYTRLKVVTQWIIFHVPGIGKLVREATIARFGVILGGLLRAGVPLVEALESLHNVTDVVKYKVFYKELWKRIELGDSFSAVFKSNKATGKLLPVSVQQLVITGEKSGTLANTLLKVSDIYEKKAESTAEKLPVILEPMLLLVIGSLVAGIAMSIIVPIYSLVGSIGN